MKLRSLVNLSIMSEDTLVGFFYAVSNEDPPPFHQRDNLYHQVDWDEYSVSSDDDPQDEEDYINLEVGDRMYTFSDVLRMYKQLNEQGSFDPDNEKFYIYVSPNDVVNIEELLENG